MAASSQPGVVQTGKISWFGGPNDPSAGGAPASGLGWIPGISTFNQATLRGYWLVTMPNGRQGVLQQTDIGPAPWTGRNFDFTFNALPLLGYSEGNFPTNASIKAVYLGKILPAKFASLNLSSGGKAGAAGTGALTATALTPTSSSTPSTTPAAGPAGGDFFGAHSSSLLYATVWVGALAAALYLIYQGTDRTTHGAVTRTRQRAQRAAGAAAVAAA